MLALADGTAAGERVESQLDRLLLGASGALAARLYPAALRAAPLPLGLRA